MSNKIKYINTTIPSRDEILSRFSHAQNLDFGGNIWNTAALMDPAKKTGDCSSVADAYLSAWNLLWESFSQADIHSVEEIKDDELDWQIYNWAGDAGIALLNAKRWEDCINLNEQILEFGWRQDEVELTDPNSGNLKRGAHRDIAECYAEMRKIDTSEEKFQEYLLGDPFWGWGWIGYLQMLEKYEPEKLNKKSEFVLLNNMGVNEDGTRQDGSLLHATRLFIEANPVAMDANMLDQIADIYRKHGTPEDAAFFINAYHTTFKEPNKRIRTKPCEKFSVSEFKYIQDWAKSNTGTSPSTSAPIRKGTKIGRNDPCPCGSGK